MSELGKELESALMSAPPEPSPYETGTVRVIHLEVDNCYACPFHDGMFDECRKTRSDFSGAPGPMRGILKDCPLPKKETKK